MIEEGLNVSKPITVLYPITDLARDGAQRQLLELVRGLDRERFRPMVLTLRSGGAMEAEFQKLPGLELISIGQKSKYDIIIALFKVWKVIRVMRIDIIQPFLTPATFYGLLLAFLGRVPVKIVTERLGPGRRNAHFGYRFYLKMEDILSRFADWVIPNSAAGKEYLIQRGITVNRIKVIYNGLNLERLHTKKDNVEQVRQRLGVPRQGKVIGMMARMFPQKRYDIFLEAASIVHQTVPDTRFALVGDGPLKGHMEELSRRLGLAESAVFFGEQTDVSPYLSAFDIAVLTSETEGCSNFLLEAMALGKPVVATDVGGNRELIDDGKTGLLVPREDPKALATAIFRLLREPATAQAIGQRAKEKINTQFSLEKMVHEYQSLYEGADGRAKKFSAVIA